MTALAASDARARVDPGVTVVHTVEAFRSLIEEARHAGASVGLVPTMGALHAGHCSLVAAAAAQCDVVAVTVFVNPLQFGDPDDLTAYPRTLDADVELAAAAGAGIVFAPTVTEMYPAFPVPPATTVSVGGVSTGWEGASRPGHFDGVATVVAKLFAMAGPCRAYFGEKDFQQLAVVRRLAADLSLPVTIVGCPTVREPDGLAMSSRNTRLDPAGRRAATVLARALAEGAAAVRSGAADPGRVSEVMSAVVGAEPSVDLDYAAVVDAGDLEVPGDLAAHRAAGGRQRLLIAATVGAVRLIDNLDPWDDAPAVPERAGAPPERTDALSVPTAGTSTPGTVDPTRDGPSGPERH